MAKAGFGKALERFVRKAAPDKAECMSAEGNRWHRPGLSG
jgi:hypothetical protein